MDIKSALDTITEPVSVEAPSKSKKEVIKEDIIKPNSKTKKTRKDVLEETKKKKIEKLDQLSMIIEKIDTIEDKLELKKPLKISEPIVTQKEPEEIVYPTDKEVEENLKNKDPLKVDHSIIKVENNIKQNDLYKAFEGYNMRRFNSLSQVPKFIIKRK